MIEADDFRYHNDRRAALMEMRARMTAVTTARICLAGRKRPGTGPSGIIEEAAMMVHAHRPLYMSRMMGGAAAAMIACIRRDYVPSADHFGTESLAYLNVFQHMRVNDVGRLCGLSDAEVNDLFDAENIDTIVYLVARGLGKLLRLS
jgi:hypothetical protein